VAIILTGPARGQASSGWGVWDLNALLCSSLEASYDVSYAFPVEGQKQILVIEDDDSIRDALAELYSSEGYSVAVAENGFSGLAALAATHPCVVFLDLMMPVMDGR